MIRRYASDDLYVELEGDLCRHPEGDEIENIRVRQVLILGHEVEFSSLPEGIQKTLLALQEEDGDWTDD